MKITTGWMHAFFDVAFARAVASGTSIAIYEAKTDEWGDVDIVVDCGKDKTGVRIYSYDIAMLDDGGGLGQDLLSSVFLQGDANSGKGLVALLSERYGITDVADVEVVGVSLAGDPD